MIQQQRPAIDPRLLEEVKGRVGLRRALSTMRERRTPIWAQEIILRASIQYDEKPTLLLGACRRRNVFDARSEAIYLIKQKNPRLESTLIAKWFGRSHPSILFSLARHAERTGMPSLTAYDLPRRKGEVP